MKKQQETTVIMARQGNRRQQRARLHRCSTLTGLLPILITALANANPGSAEHLISYRLSVNDSLSEILVQARLPNDQRSLGAVDGQPRLLRDLAGCQGETVSVRADRIAAADANGCLQYRYPLKAQSGRRSPPVRAGVRVSTPGEWLWLPELLPGERLLIEVESAAAVSVPWLPLGDNRYELRPSPGSATGTAAFGDFTALTLETAGATLQVAALDGPDMQLDEGKLLEWLGVAAADVAGVGGRFPNPSVQVIVQPVRSRGQSPVPFGYVIRDGGEAVRFFVDPGRAVEDYHADWTATHEFAHLLLPYVRSREKWVSEGFASYYQNVLLARRGAYGEAEVWARLDRSFSRAAEVRYPPRLDRMHQRSFREVRMLVYWSGAALALEADVQLRTQDSSLDGVLGELADCCLPSERIWTAAELFETLDAFAAEPVFMPLYERYMAQRGMPELDTLYEQLGIRKGTNGVALTAEGRLSAIREAIMRANTGRRTGRRETGGEFHDR